MKRFYQYCATPAFASVFGATAGTRGCLMCTPMRVPIRGNSTPGTSGAVSAQINDMFDSFAEARELIRDAMESAGSVYFHEDMEDAIAMTQQTLAQWQKVQEALRDSGDEAMLARLVKENELKMKQLEAELEEAKHAGGE